MPLLKVLPKYDLHVIDAEMVSTHGGSLRVYCSKTESKKSQALIDLLAGESELSTSFKTTSSIQKFYDKVYDVINKLSLEIQKAKADNTLIWGYTAPAKATTWLASLHSEVRENIRFVIDDSPLKQGKYIPGTSIPIFSSAFVKDELNLDINDLSPIVWVLFFLEHLRFFIDQTRSRKYWIRKVSCSIARGQNCE